MSEIKSYRDLIAWQKSVDLAVEVYRFTRLLPPDERFGLIAQLRRAVVSVPSNIAEGYGKGTTADYIRFLRTSRGSLYEVDTQSLLALKLEFVSGSAYEGIREKINECGRILAALIRSLEDKQHSPDRIGAAPVPSA